MKQPMILIENTTIPLNQITSFEINIDDEETTVNLVGGDSLNFELSNPEDWLRQFELNGIQIIKLGTTSWYVVSQHITMIEKEDDDTFTIHTSNNEYTLDKDEGITHDQVISALGEAIPISTTTSDNSNDNTEASVHVNSKTVISNSVIFFGFGVLFTILIAIKLLT